MGHPPSEDHLSEQEREQRKLGRLTKEQLADKSRFQFKRQEVELPEIGGSVVVKTLTVAERDALPDMVNQNGKPGATIDALAETFAAIVEDPAVTAEEAKAFLGDWPASALDEVIVKFSDLLGTTEESAAADEFRGGQD